MPFARDAELVFSLKNNATASVQVSYSATRVDENTYYFFAHWTARGPLSTRPFQDITVAKVSGEGAYVGTLLTLDSPSEEWWGEGDEKIWVDDDSFPSWFGTGTEDYFGYAYSTRDQFDHPYRLLSATGPRRAQVSNTRFHVLDVIRFYNSLRFDLELWHWRDTPVYFDTLAYFYGSSQMADQVNLAVAEDFRVPPP
jgi:hypothetical protein